MGVHMSMNMEKGQNEYIIDYRKKIIDMVNGINDESVLKKIFTVTKTHIDILNWKKGS